MINQIILNCAKVVDQKECFTKFSRWNEKGRAIAMHYNVRHLCCATEFDNMYNVLQVCKLFPEPPSTRNGQTRAQT